MVIAHHHHLENEENCWFSGSPPEIQVNNSDLLYVCVCVCVAHTNEVNFTKVFFKNILDLSYVEIQENVNVCKLFSHH